MSNLERLFERYFEIHPYDIEDNELCTKHFPSINGIYAALHAPEPSAQADAALDPRVVALIRLVRDGDWSLGHREGANVYVGPSEVVVGIATLEAVVAALSSPADSFTNVNESPPLDLECLECGGRIDYVKGRPATPPLDVERLAERLRDLREPGTTSNDERYDLGWYDGIGAALAALANPDKDSLNESPETK